LVFILFIVFLKKIQIFKKEESSQKMFDSKKEERESVKVFVKGNLPKRVNTKGQRKWGTTIGQFLDLCKCSLRNLGESRLGSPIPLSASPFGQLGCRVGPHFGKETGNFGELSPGCPIHSAHRPTSTQIAELPCPFVEFGESIFKLAS